MNNQLQTLLNDSLGHYKARQLKKALISAQIALEFGLNGGAGTYGVIQANLLLSRIFTANGRYQNEPSFFKKAINYIEESERLNNNLNDQNFLMSINLMFGKVYLSSKKYDTAKSYLNKSLSIAYQLQSDEGVVYSLGTLSQLYISINQIDEGTNYAEEALAYLNKNVKINHRELWNEAHLQLSQAYIKKQEYSRSLEMSQLLLRSCKEVADVEKEIFALRNIAVVCGVKSNYKIGMQYFLDALDKCETIGYRELYVQLQVNIGTLYAHLYNYPEAIRRYQSVLEEHGELLEDMNKIVVYNNLGNIYLSTHSPEKALEYFEKSQQLADKGTYPSMQAHALAQLSRTKLQLDQLESAKTDAIAAQKLIDQLGQINGKQINLLNRGEIAFREGDMTLAHQFTTAAVEAAQQVKDDACEIRCYKHMARIFKAEKKYEKALEYEEKYGEIQEAFAKEQYDRQFLDMEIRHAIKEKQKAIEVLTKENEYQALLLQKSDQIASQNKELLRVNEDLKQFAYVASHDLKEPIRMIGSFTQIIHKKTKNLLDPKDHQYFDFINGGVNRMNELLDGLLKYATIGNHDLNFEEIDLNEIMMVCLANLHVRIGETEADISYGKLPVINSNKSLVIQLFQNLISNAIKFTKKDVTPIVKIGSYTTESEHVFFVKDNGIGISPEYKTKIFEIFHRLHARDTYEGTGIGLAICQKIASRLHGKLWVDSEPDKGSTFYFSTPI